MRDRLYLPAPFASADSVPTEWKRYLEGVYGTGVLADNKTFPLDLARFNVFYERLLPDALRQLVHARPLLSLVDSANESHLRPADALCRRSNRRGHCRVLGRRAFDVYSHWPDMSTAFVYRYNDSKPASKPSKRHPPKPALALWPGGEAPVESAHLQYGHASHKLVEVAHCYEDADDFYWLYHAVGSGVWFDLGRTYVAKNAIALWFAPEVNVSISSMLAHSWRGRRTCRTVSTRNFAPGFYCGTSAEIMHQQYRMTRKALGTLAESGYDSVQFVQTEEHGMHKYEIIDLRSHRRVIHCYDAYHERRAKNTGCTLKRPPAADHAAWMSTPAANACPPRGNESVYRVGWRGQGGPCRCRRSARNRCLTCEGMHELVREV